MFTSVSTLAYSKSLMFGIECLLGPQSFVYENSTGRSCDSRAAWGFKSGNQEGQMPSIVSKDSVP